MKLQLPVINISSLKVFFEDHRTYASDAAVSDFLTFEAIFLQLLFSQFLTTTTAHPHTSSFSHLLKAFFLQLNFLLS